MPHVVNGIGTWYHGKTNIRKRMGQCESCKAYGELTSYDTTEYFVVFFIPLIPLGKKRVFAACPQCRRMRVMPLSKWQAAREEHVTPAVEACLAAPKDAQKAKDAIGVTVGMDDQDSFLLVSESIEKSLPADADVQRSLGAAYGYFSFPEPAEDAYRRSLAVKDDVDVRTYLALSLLRQGRTGEAEEVVEPDLSKNDQRAAELTELLVEGYQAEGEHAAALSLLKRLEAAQPGMSDNGTIWRLKKGSMDGLSSGRRIPSSIMSRPTQVDERSGRWWARGARWVAPGIVLAVLAIYIAVAVVSGMNRRVHLVNGLSRPYDVEVNGVRYTLMPGGHREIRVSEGTVRVQGVGSGSGIGTQTCTVHTSFWSRPFSSRVFVLNPDQTAVVMWEQTFYSPPGSSPLAPMPAKLFTGRLLHDLDGVDYEFAPFPGSLSVSNKTGMLSKTRVDLAPPLNPIAVVGVVLKTAPEDAKVYLRQRIKFGEADDLTIAMAMRTLGEGETMGLIAPILSVRPVVVAIHRLYQEQMDVGHPEHDLHGEYAAYLKAAPDDTALMYLLGRVTDERAEAKRLFEQATRGATPCGYAYHALAFDAAAEGRFSEAADLEQKALAVLPGRFDFQLQRVTALESDGRYGEAIQVLNQMPAEQKMLYWEQLARLYTVSNDSAAIQKMMHDESDHDSKEYLRGVTAYARGDMREFVAATRGAGSPALRFQALMVEGKYAEAVGTLGQGDSEPGVRLLLYIGLDRAGESKAAVEQWRAAVDEMKKGGRRQRALAAVLERNVPPTERELEDVTTHSLPQPILLTALGRRFPQSRAGYYEKARRLNQVHSFPYWELKAVLDAEAAPAGAGRGR